ncbi:dTDP-glucose 4,6-dehydratase [Streptomyces sp. SP17KL33]|uniref:dTDP-glucose 4,6-dehydratase n=1 Tax=Streptomyces sp. SP17KL33 TaxID=3002534 RepID=UPI002E78CC72|nr:GDP-mannose 4,6-dehydratase [Streptomyces sp. SP17KL33]MEE1831701.1 GDP-mannose 4,6-dehydratase [Streptomyces sp. SP17KL33]
MSSIERYWTGRPVLITGADGFIGSHLTEALVRLGAEVTAVVRRVSAAQVTNRLRNLPPSAVNSLHRLVHLDLAGPSAVPVLSGIEAATWFHLAADAYVPASLDQPASVVQTNVASTLNVLEAARLNGPEHLLVTSSSEVYGTQPDAITEQHPLMPATPYAASKVACDRLAWSYAHTYDMPVTIVRPFNCYGPRHVYDAVPIFLAKALRNEPITINGTGEQTRDLTYVADTVEGFLTLAQLSGTGEAYNVGTGVDHTIVDVAHLVVELTDSRSEILHGPPRAGEVAKLQADPTKIRQITGWAPKFDLAAGLAGNLEWMRKNVERIWPARS